MSQVSLCVNQYTAAGTRISSGCLTKAKASSDRATPIVPRKC